MEIERIKRIKDSLMGCIENQVHGHLNEVDSTELGEAIDMIKDLSEAAYYCVVTEAMEKGEETDWGKYNDKGTYYYSPRMIPRYPIEYIDPRYRDGYNYPRYDNGNGESDMPGNGRSGGSGNRNYQEGMMTRYPSLMERDGYYYPQERHPYEGKSPDRRKRYMEGKEQHRDKTKQMQELEDYMKELSTDITEMIRDASAEEKQLLKSKIDTLMSKI